MSDYIAVSGGEQTAVTPGSFYSNDLILPLDLKLTSSTLVDSLSDSFPTDGSYPMHAASGSVEIPALYATYDWGDITWRGAGTAVVSGGQVSCAASSHYFYAGDDANLVMPYFGILASPGIRSDEQFVQCEITSVRSGQTVNSVTDNCTVGLATRSSPQNGGGSGGGFAVVANFVQSGPNVTSPTLVVSLVTDPFYYSAGIDFSFFPNLRAWPADYNVAWMGGGSFPNGGGPTLSPGDIIRLETIQTSFNIILNGVSIFSGDLQIAQATDYPLPNSIGGDSCGVYIRDDFNSGTGQLSIGNFSCGVLGDPRTKGFLGPRKMPVAAVSQLEVSATPMDVRDSVHLDTTDIEAVTRTYTSAKRMANSPYQGIISSCAIGNYGYFLSQTISFRVPRPPFRTHWGELSLSRYDPLNDVWTVLAPPPIPTLGGGSISPLVDRGVIDTHNGLIYLVVTTPKDDSIDFDFFGTHAAESFTFVYDPNIDSWSSLTPMPLENSPSIGGIVPVPSVLYGQGVIVNGKFYFPGGDEELGDESFGGPSNTACSRRNAVYDIGLDSWADETPLPFARGSGSVSHIGTDIFVLGGTYNFGIADDTSIAKYDTVGQTWTLRSTHGESSGSGTREGGLGAFDEPCFPFKGGLLLGLVTLVHPDGAFQSQQTTPRLPLSIGAFPFSLYGNCFTFIGDYIYGPYLGRGYLPGDNPFLNYFIRVDPKKMPWVI